MKNTNINRISTIVQELSHFRTELVAKGYRKLAGLPENGFSSEGKYKLYCRKHKGDDYFRHFMVALIQIRKDLRPYIDTYLFYDIFHDLYIYGKVLDKTMDNTNATGCEWLPVTENSLLDNKNKLKTGLYIKIGEYADLSHLKQFVTNGSKLFKGYKQLIWGENKYPRIRYSPYAERNKRIAILGRMTSSQLKALGGGDCGYKAMQIGVIIRKEGFGSVTDGTIRKIMYSWKED